VSQTRTTPTDSGSTDIVSKQQWRWVVLASMASYIDAGSIVAGASGLALWKQDLSLSSFTVGLLGAISANALSAAIGSAIGGRLGDRFGRKKIYAYDLLVYAAGATLAVFAINLPMLIAAFVVIGLAVGADVPTSLALVGELAPAKARGKLIGVTQMAWSLGPIVVLLLAFSLSGLGLVGTRIVFAHLVVVALVTWYLRRGIVESVPWTTAAASAQTGAPRYRMTDLFHGRYLRALLFTGGVYILWNLAAGTKGFFLPYILSTAGAQSHGRSLALQCATFIASLATVYLVFMRFSDGPHRRRIFIIGAVLQVVGWAILAALPMTSVSAIGSVVLLGLGSGMAGEAFYKLWSQEMFPTLLRATAQGFTFAVARILLAGWSLLVPLLIDLHHGLTILASVLAVLLAAFGVLGAIGMPDSAGRSLTELEGSTHG
jgi:MFS transporter, SP family, inositol transporter